MKGAMEANIVNNEFFDDYNKKLHALTREWSIKNINIYEQYVHDSLLFG